MVSFSAVVTQQCARSRRLSPGPRFCEAARKKIGESHGHVVISPRAHLLSPLSVLNQHESQNVGRISSGKLTINYYTLNDLFVNSSKIKIIFNNYVPTATPKFMHRFPDYYNYSSYLNPFLWGVLARYSISIKLAYYLYKTCFILIRGEDRLNTEPIYVV